MKPYTSTRTMATNNRLPRKDSSHCILMQKPQHKHAIYPKSLDIYVLFSLKKSTQVHLLQLVILFYAVYEHIMELFVGCTSFWKYTRSTPRVIGNHGNIKNGDGVWIACGQQ